MAIQTQLNYDSRIPNRIGFPMIGGRPEISSINGAGFDHSFINLQITRSQKNTNQEELYRQQCQSQSNLAAHMEQQSQEINQFVVAQRERLRVVLQEQRKQLMEAVLRNMEAKALVLMNGKDEEIARASTKKMELESLLRKMEMENLRWQKTAREKEAMVETLNSTLEQVRERDCYGAAAVDDEGSCCGGGAISPVAGACSDDENVMSCRKCGSGEACILFLPCRHLCCCINCHVSLDRCPVCQTPKKAAIEALIF